MPIDEIFDRLRSMVGLSLTTSGLIKSVTAAVLCMLSYASVSVMTIFEMMVNFPIFLISY